MSENTALLFTTTLTGGIAGHIWQQLYHKDSIQARRDLHMPNITFPGCTVGVRYPEEGTLLGIVGGIIMGCGIATWLEWEPTLASIAAGAISGGIAANQLSHLIEHWQAETNTPSQSARIR